MGKHKVENRIKNDAQVSSYINEGNPDIRKSSSDQQSAQMVKQAIKDDQGLSAVAKNIHVSVNEGTITLDGKVSTDQQMNLATNTASAVAVGDKIKNRMEVTNNS